MSKYYKIFGSHVGVDGNSLTVQQDVFLHLYVDFNSFSEVLTSSLITLEWSLTALELSAHFAIA